MNEIELRGSPESVIESIRFARSGTTVGPPCGGRHRYTITWAHCGEPGGPPRRWVDWCDHPLCPFEESRWRLRDSPAEVKLTAWVPAPGRSIAVAYLLVVYPLDALPRMEARIGICDQWEDRRYGNGAAERDPRRLFSQRYFAESGPGIYPAHIVDVPPVATE